MSRGEKKQVGQDMCGGRNKEAKHKTKANQCIISTFAQEHKNE